MADPNPNPNPVNEPVIEEPVVTEDPPKLDPEDDLFQKRLQEEVAKQLKPMKENIDKAYQLRDKAVEEAEKIKEEKRLAEIQRLEEEGNHKAAYEKKLEQLAKENKTLISQNVELTRDNDVRAALSALEFKNDKSYEMARRDIVDQLVKTESGVWVHRSGQSIQEYVSAFAEDNTNSFLFKVQRSTGSGRTTPDVSTQVTSTAKDNESLFSKSQDEVLKLAAAGKLPHQQQN